MKEQSSILGTTSPKITLPNKDLVGVKKSKEKKEITKEETKLPKPSNDTGHDRLSKSLRKWNC